MRAIANLAASADYRPNILQAKALPLAVSMLRNAQLQGSGSHTFAVLCHAARAIGNLCAGGEIAAAMQQKAAAEARNSAQFCPQFCPQFCAIILNPHLPRHAGVDRRAAPLALPRARAP